METITFLIVTLIEETVSECFIVPNRILRLKAINCYSSNNSSPQQTDWANKNKNIS